MSRYPTTSLVIAAALAVHGPSAAQDILVQNATVYTMDAAGVVPNGDVLVREGRIVQVGADLSASSGVTILEGDGWFVMPGMIDLHSHMTTQDERGGGSDRHERGQRVNTGLRILDSVNPQYGWLGSALEGGVTVLHVMPGSNAPFGGQTVLIKAVPKPTVDDMLLERIVGMKMSMTATRGTGTAEMREWFIKGQEYQARWERWENGDREGVRPRRDLQLEGIAMQLSGELQTHTHAGRAIEIQYALKMKREFGLDVVLQHAHDAWKIVDDIKESGVAVSFGPIRPHRGSSVLYGPGLLADAGVKVALNMDSASDFQKHLLHAAQIAIRYGMDRMDALESVTINPAEIMRVDDRVGSLTPGKDGDLVILDGDPLSTFSHVLYTIVEGAIVYQRNEGS
jgi:imidazolonepropionase-like amidohydrolase